MSEDSKIDTTTVTKTQQETEPDYGSMIEKKLKELWNGDVPLKQTFWLYHIVAQFVLGVLATIMLPKLIGLIGVLWAGFMVKPIFSSASKYEGSIFWAVSCKIVAVFLALAVLGKLIH